jgi:transcriptional regulator with XRE-family HTH domain
MKERRNNLRISAIMKEKGLTLPDLAARITVTDKDGKERTLTSAALGARINGNPHLSNLYEIADALGVKITELFPQEDQCTKAPAGKFKIQTICPSCGAKISASVTAE